MMTLKQSDYANISPALQDSEGATCKFLMSVLVSETFSGIRTKLYAMQATHCQDVAVASLTP